MSSSFECSREIHEALIDDLLTLYLCHSQNLLFYLITSVYAFMLYATAAYKYISFHYDEIFAFSESDSAKISPMTSLTENKERSHSYLHGRTTIHVYQMLEFVNVCT